MKNLITILIFLFLSGIVWGQVYISEYSDANGSGNYVYEFVEIYNDANTDVDVSGYVLRQKNATHSYTLPSGTSIPAKGILVIGRNSNQADFESFWEVTFSSNVTYVNSGNKCPQINGDEVFLFEDNSGNNVDPLPDDAYTAEPVAKNKRVKRLSTGNSTSDYDGTDNADNATPGTLENDQVLPVELTTFTALASGNVVELHWKTATEVNNYGFYVERASESLAATNSGESKNWETIDFVNGHGNSSSPKEYSYVDETIGGSGKYFYRLKQVDVDGSYEYSPVVEVYVGAPEKFELSQNYPNPFNPATTITYSIPQTGVGSKHALTVQLKIYDVLGREVATLVNKHQSPGRYTVKFNASKLNSGIYFYKLQAGDYTQVKRMMLVK